MPRNTADGGNVEKMIVAGTPGGIEEQEAIGQAELVHDDTLPTESLRGCREKLKELGVEFLDPIEGDPLFCRAKLPVGWSKKVTPHSMWTHLVNADREVVALLFYKAAFYDRKAHMMLPSEES